MYGFISGQRRRPSFSLQPNRVDALPQLLHFDDGPTSLATSTDTLPTRTSCSESHLEKLGTVYNIIDDQNHAFYEEIHSLPATAFGIKSPFEKTGHWYMIHPLNWTKASELSTLILNKLEKWIVNSEHLYTGKSAQVVLFKEKRTETLELVQKELRKRGVKEAGNEEGYLGKWEEVRRLTLKDMRDDRDDDGTNDMIEPEQGRYVS